MKLSGLRAIPRPLIPLAILDLAIKGVAAWKAARNKQFVWCIALVVFNTAGVLPVLYLLRFQKKAGTPN
jgi:hypothetical protein